MEWKAARSSVARLLRSSWYNKAAEREQQELPKEAVEVNCTLLTSRVREPEASQQWKPEPPGETVSHTQEETNPPLEVSPPQEQENPQKCKPSSNSPYVEVCLEARHGREKLATNGKTEYRRLPQLW